MSLKMTVAELRRELGRYLGVGSGPDEFESKAALAIDDAIRNGLREFYFPFVDGEPHNWSFLSSLVNLSLVNAQASYELPADFLRVSSVVTIDGKEYPCRQITESAIRTMGQQSQESGVPLYYAIVPDGHDSGRPKHKIRFYPVPDESMTASLWVLSDPLFDLDSDDVPGGAVHARAMLQCCLAAAEQSLNIETVGPGGGLHTAKASVMLLSSIDADRRLQGLDPLPRQPVAE